MDLTNIISGPLAKPLGIDVDDLLFGTKPSAKILQAPRWDPSQIGLKEQLTDWLQMGEMGRTKATAYPGAFAAQLSPLEQLSLAGLEEYTRGIMTGEGPTRTTTATTGTTEMGTLDPSARSFLETALTAGPEEFEEYFQKSIYEPAERTLFEKTMPQIKRAYAPSGLWGSERVGTEQEAIESFLRSMGEQRATTAYAARESSLNRALEAAGMFPTGKTTTGETGVEEFDIAARGDILSKLLTAGGIPRGVEQTELVGQLQDWLRQEEEPQKRAAMILQLLGYPAYESAAVGLPGQAGLLQSLAQGAGQAAGMAGTMALMG